MMLMNIKRCVKRNSLKNGYIVGSFCLPEETGPLKKVIVIVWFISH